MLKKLQYALSTIIVCLVMSNSFSQTITVTDPNGGETLYACETYTITRNTSGTLSDYYDIDYSLDGGTIWASIATNFLSTNGQFVWTVPQVQSANCLIRLTDAQNGTIWDQSDAVFTINIPIIVTAPNGGETFPAQSSQTITWTALGTSNVFDIFYSINNGSTWISDELLAQIRMYPNPSLGTLNINFGDILGMKNIVVLDMTGKVVFRTETQESVFTKELEIADRMYHVIIRSEDGELYFNEKLIVQ